MVQSHNVRAIHPQLAPTPDRLINNVLGEGVWDLAADHYKVSQQSSAAMSVRVGSGTAFDKIVVAGDAAGQQTYIAENQDPRSGDGNGDISIGNGGAQDRIDLVVFRIWDDKHDSTGLWKGEVEVIPGDEAADPDVPAVPDTAMPLAAVDVAAGLDSGITNAMITDLRVQSAPAGPLAIAASDLPQGVLDDADITADTGGTTAEVDVAGLSVTVDVPADRKIRVLFDGRVTGGADSEVTIRLKEDGTLIRSAPAGIPSSGRAIAHSAGRVLTPTAGEHTYKVTLARTAGSGNAQVIASAASPAQIVVEDIGPA